MKKCLFATLTILSVTSSGYATNGEPGETQDGLLGTYKGSYNLSAQVERVKELSKQGLKLGLIIGRGNLEIKDLDPLPAEFTWVYANINATFMAANEPSPHLWLDCDNEKHLSKIPKGIFDQVLVDQSTWKLVKNAESTIQQHHRILNDGGKLIFESTVKKEVSYSFEDTKISYYPEKAPIAYCVPLSITTQRTRAFIDFIANNPKLKKVYDESNPRLWIAFFSNLNREHFSKDILLKLKALHEEFPKELLDQFINLNNLKNFNQERIEASKKMLNYLQLSFSNAVMVNGDYPANNKNYSLSQSIDYFIATK